MLQLLHFARPQVNFMFGVVFCNWCFLVEIQCNCSTKKWPPSQYHAWCSILNLVFLSRNTVQLQYRKVAQSSPVHMAKALQSDCVGAIFRAWCTALRCYLTLGDGIQPLRFQPVTFTRMFSAKIYTISGRLPKWLWGYKMMKLNRPTEFSRNYLAQICSKIR